MATVRKIVSLIEEIAPLMMSESWDNSGLQLGEWQMPCHKVGIALEVTPEVVQSACSEGIDLLVTHHPLLFKGVKQLDTSRPVPRAIADFIARGVSVYAAHTNYDVAPHGLNYHLARRLGLERTSVLRRTGRIPYFKVVVYVPAPEVEKVFSAMARAGAGCIGNYDHTSFRVIGEGTFRPLAGANPYLGSVGQLERVKEVRLEMIVDEPNLNRVLSAMRQAHPYEEIAYDVIALHRQGVPYGLGRIGELTEDQELGLFAARTAEALEVGEVRLYGDPSAVIRRVAVCSGSGASCVEDALQLGADVLVTGDVDHHAALDAIAAGLNVLDAGHVGTEKIFVPELARQLRASVIAEKIDVKIREFPAGDMFITVRSV